VTEERLRESRVAGTVRVVGSGLLGASVGLGLAGRGVDVVVTDASRTAARLAVEYGTGHAPADGDSPALIVVAVPPDAIAEVVGAELAAFPGATVTDVASVKSAPLAELEASVAPADLARYVGSHPLAGRERGGPISARADLFLGRPWVVCTRPGLARERVSLIEQLALDLGAIPVEMDARVHDESVALVSHTPQLVSTLMARRLAAAQDAAIGLAGGGVRDVTRVASSDPALWVQILAANASVVAPILRAYRDDLGEVIDALERIDEAGSRRAIAETLAGGNAGVARLPGKHGQDKRFASVVVLIDDTPGQLGRLFTELGELGINIEDMRMEHSPGAQIGIVELAVLPEALARTVGDLTERGWRIAG